MITCWKDSMGDSLEVMGAASGRIFEHCGAIAGLTDDGIVVQTANHLAEGIEPISFYDINSAWGRRGNKTFKLTSADLRKYWRKFEFC